MKICLIAPTYLPARRANTIQVMKMAQALTALGHEVIVTVPAESNPSSTPTWDELAHFYGLKYHFKVEWLPVLSRLRGYDYGYRAIQFARKQGCNLIYTRLPQAAGLASYRGIPTVYEVHDIPKGRGAKVLLRLFLSGSGARRLVLITRALRDDLARWQPTLPPSPFTTIAPDGVDLDRYADLPSSAEARATLSLSERFTIGYTGHLYPGRGTELILALAERLPEVAFLLVGGNPKGVTSFRAEAENKALENIRLTGFVPNAELPRYQAACDILLMPYQQRVAASSGGDIARYLSPMKVFEYLACGRPIISSDLPVLKEVLNTANALLLPPAEVDSWVEAIQDLRTNQSLRESLSQQARVDAAMYTWEARAEKIFGHFGNPQ